MLVDVASANREYRAAASAFPFELPPQWTFPVESGLVEGAPGTLWEVGTGRAQAYMYWQAAVVEAAQAASERGAAAESERLLQLLDKAYDSDTRRDAIEDPQATIAVAVESTLATTGGDVSTAQENFEELSQIVRTG